MAAVLVCLFLSGFAVSTAKASTPYERESLRDLPGVVLHSINFTSTPTNLEDELPLAELRSEVKLAMRKAGIPLIDYESHASSVVVPHLQIQGAVSQIAANFYAYTIVIELHQEAALLRKTGQRSLMVTWSEGSLSTGDIQHFRDRLLLLAHFFIRDFESVNSRSSQVWPLSLE